MSLGCPAHRVQALKANNIRLWPRRRIRYVSRLDMNTCLNQEYSGRQRSVGLPEIIH